MMMFRRSLFGYNRSQVEAAISSQESRIGALTNDLGHQHALATEYEAETASLSGMVIEREREIRALTLRLQEANECHDRSIASLDAVTARLEELQEQARGQATRIRMKALREAVEVSARMQALTDAHEDASAPASNGNGAEPAAAEPVKPAEPVEIADFDGLYEGQVKLEIGPLGDFSQLVGFEDAVGQLGASEISVERFSEGRATLRMHLDEPVDLLRELEDLSRLDFKVRHTAPDNLILDLDEDEGPEQRAA